MTRAISQPFLMREYSAIRHHPPTDPRRCCISTNNSHALQLYNSIQYLESLTRYKMSSTVCLRLCTDGSSVCYFTVTLNFDLLIPQFKAFISIPWYIIDVSLAKVQLILSANKPRKSCFQHTLFHCDLDRWPFDPKLWSVHRHPIMHSCCTFGENVSNTLQDIVLTIFRDEHTSTCTHTDKQDKNSMSLATLHWAEAW